MAILRLMLSSLLLAACSLAAASGAAATTFFPAATSPQIRVIGRTGRNGTTLWFDWSSVAIEVHAVGPLSITLQEVQIHGQEYAIILNSSGSVREWQLNTTFNVSQPVEYPLLGAGESGLLRIEKVTESRTDVGGAVGFLGLRAASLGAKPPVSARRIECIGDSIMAGNHAKVYAPYPASCELAGRCDPKNCSGTITSWARESSRLSWCPVLARALGADYEVEAISGNGLVMPPVSKTDGLPQDQTMFWQQSERLACTRFGGGLACPFANGSHPLDTSWYPHAVLMNMGQNDYGAPAGTDPKTGKPTPSHRPTTQQWVSTCEYTSTAEQGDRVHTVHQPCYICQLRSARGLVLSLACLSELPPLTRAGCKHTQTACSCITSRHCMPLRSQFSSFWRAVACHPSTATTHRPRWRA
jgi:hypothetical protein